MQHATRALARAVSASVCASILLLQAAALPVLHVLHWSETLRVGEARQTVATCCPHGHGSAIGSADAARPLHDPGACPTCTALAQHRGAAVVAPGFLPAPALEAVHFVAAGRHPASRTARGVAAPRAPPLLRA